MYDCKLRKFTKTTSMQMQMWIMQIWIMFSTFDVHFKWLTLSDFSHIRYTKIRKLEKCQKFCLFDLNSWSLHSVDYFEIVMDYNVETWPSSHILYTFFILNIFRDTSCQKKLRSGLTGMDWARSVHCFQLLRWS